MKLEILSNKNKSLLAGILLIAVGLLAYSSVFHAQFIWDDDVLITDNILVKSPGGLSKIWLSTQPVDYFPPYKQRLLGGVASFREFFPRL